MNRKERLKYRNEQLKIYFAELEKKNPQWTLSALLEETANKFPPISTQTVAVILKQRETK